MTDDEKTTLFKRVFCNADGERVLEVLKRELGFNTRTMLREDDRHQCYWLGKASVIQYILDIINSKKKTTNGKSRQ